jgi:hypothetical protein
MRVWNKDFHCLYTYSWLNIFKLTGKVNLNVLNKTHFIYLSLNYTRNTEFLLQQTHVTTFVSNLYVWRNNNNFVEQSPSWETNIFSFCQKKLPAFYAPIKFITVFTRSCHWIPSWVRWIQSKFSYLVSLGFILILSSPIHLRLQNYLFHWGFLTKIL